MQQLRRLAFFDRLLVQPQFSSGSNASDIFAAAVAAGQQQLAAGGLPSGVSAAESDACSAPAALPDPSDAAAAAGGGGGGRGGGGGADACASWLGSSLPAAAGAGGIFVCGAGTPTQLWLCDEGGLCYIFDEALRSLLLPVFSHKFLAIHFAEAAACMICVGRDRVDASPSGGPAAAAAAGSAGPGGTTARAVATASRGTSSTAAKNATVSSSSSTSAAAARSAAARSILKYKCFSCVQVDAAKKPLLLREAPMFTNLPEQQLTCSDVSSNFHMLALGTQKAGVCLFRGDLLREKTCRLRLLRQEGAATVTAVCFLKRNDAATEGTAAEEISREYLFVATLHAMLCYSVPIKGEPQITFQDDHGGLSSPLLACRLNAWKKVAVQRGDGIFCLDAEQGRLWAVPCDEEESHTMLATYKHYLVAVAQEKVDGPPPPLPAAAAAHRLSSSALAGPAERPAAAAAAGRQQHHSHVGSSTPPPRRVQQNYLTIYRMSTDARFIAFSSAVPEVLLVVAALESLFVVCLGVGGRGSSSQRPRHVLFELREKSFNDRINILLRKRLFDWAADLVVQELQPQPVLQEVYGLHADWLYAKGQYDMAIRMHIKTIGCVEPSYVIEKYLSCQRLDLLAQYLLQLHRDRRGVAQQQHTLLFFKCAAQLKNEQLLQAFLSDPGIRQREVLLPAVIHECRSSGYMQLAGSIAARQGLHDEVVAILLDDYSDFDGAMNYIKGLDTPAACALLLAHGHVLLCHKPKEALQLIKLLVEQYRVNADVFVPLFLDLEPLLLYFLSSLLFSASVAEELLLLLQRLLLSAPAAAAEAAAADGGPDAEEEASAKKQRHQQLRQHRLAQARLDIAASSLSPTSSTSPVSAAKRQQQMQQTPALESLRLLLLADAAADARPAAATTSAATALLQEPADSAAAASSSSSSSSSPSSPFYGKISFLTCLELLLRFYRKARGASVSSPAAERRERPQQPQEDRSSSSNSSSGEEDVGGGTGDVAAAAVATAEERGGRRRRGSSRMCDAAEGEGERGEAAAAFARLAMRALREHPMSEEELFGATVLCTLYDFSEGQLFACEQRRDFQLPLSCWTSSAKLPQIFSLCCSHASTSPAVWLQALAFFATQPGKEVVIREVLSRMEQKRELFSPLVVLNVLRQRGSTVTLGAIKEYFLQAFERLNAEVEASASRLREDQGSIKKMEGDMRALAFHGRLFDKSRCDSCEQPLELPSVHISCGHSFHLYCVDETAGKGEAASPLVLLPGAADALLLAGGGGAADYAAATAASGGPGVPRYCCPLCSPEAEAKRLLLAQRQGERGNWEDFFKFLRGADDGFSFMASYFGKEMFLPEGDQLQPSFPSARFHALAGLVPPEEAKFTRRSSQLQQRFVSGFQPYIRSSYLPSPQSLRGSETSPSSSSPFSSAGEVGPGRFPNATAALSHSSSAGKRQSPRVRTAVYDHGNPAAAHSADHIYVAPTAPVSTNPFEPASPSASLSTLPSSSAQSTNPF